MGDLLILSRLSERFLSEVEKAGLAADSLRRDALTGGAKAPAPILPTLSVPREETGAILVRSPLRGPCFSRSLSRACHARKTDGAGGKEELSERKRPAR